MVLINVLNETMEAVMGNDQGNYIEERMLIKQMGMFIDINDLYEPLKRHLASGISFDLLPSNLQKEYTEAVWLSLMEKLYDILPDQEMAENFRNNFENRTNKDKVNDRIASLQNDLITYFIDDLKAKSFDETLDIDVKALLSEYENNLITPGSFALDDPDMNIGLEESIAFFTDKKKECESFIGGISVK